MLKINFVCNVEKQRKLVTQQRFTRQEPEQQQRNSTVKGASPLLFSQPSEDKVFCENNLSVLSQLIVTL